MMRIALPDSRRGFSLIETIIGMMVGTLVLGGIYSMWKHNHIETLRLQAKIEARNQLVLASKKLSRSITLAGFGMPGVPGIGRSDEIGTDTLILYSNPQELSSALSSDYTNGTHALSVLNGDVFTGATHVGISDDVHGELRRIAYRSGSVLAVSNGFEYNYQASGAKVYPAIREKFFTDQENEHLVRIVAGTSQIVGRQMKNFQVSFLDKSGNATNTISEIRNVNYSLTGNFEPIKGTLNSLVYTNATIPRNLL